ncbi:MAG: amino acid hydroxylase, partial [Chitinophagaceae bacterium]|nr:amino acid hydroxylase [Anaerolineae bacterium]
WLEGVDLLNLTPQRIPDFDEVSERLQELVGWELVSTDVIFSDGQDWFEHLARRQFLITEYIRERKDLDYTPLPDIWHDTFGHLPWMANQRYADYIEQFAHHALKFSKQERKSLGSMWWYTIEFGFMMEHGEMKAFGAGLMSSPGELMNALSDNVQKIPYSLEAFEQIDPSPHEMHKKLFVLDSFDQLEQSVEGWVAKYGKR